MTQRYTKKDVQAAAQRLANTAGIELRSGYRLPDREGVTYEEMDKTPYWLLDYVSEYGGYVIDQIDPEISLTGHFQPFGAQRRTASAFVDWTRSVIQGIEIGKNLVS